MSKQEELTVTLASTLLDQLALEWKNRILSSCLGMKMSEVVRKSIIVGETIFWMDLK